MNFNHSTRERPHPPSRGYGATSRPLERLVPNPKLKFMEQCREVMRFHRLALRTEEAYLQWIKRFLVFHRGKVTPHQSSPGFDPTSPGHFPDRGGEGEWRWKHPRELGATEVVAFLNHLANAKHVAAATQNQALNAIMFL